MASFLDIPPELQTEMVRYIKSRNDLKALCLVCRQLHALATPRLYYKINLPIKLVNDTLRRSLNSRNAAMKHTRRLFIYERDLTYPYEHAKHQHNLAHLLQSFPDNTLEEFEHTTDAVVPLGYLQQILLR